MYAEPYSVFTFFIISCWLSETSDFFTINNKSLIISQISTLRGEGNYSKKKTFSCKGKSISYEPKMISHGEKSIPFKEQNISFKPESFSYLEENYFLKEPIAYCEGTMFSFKRNYNYGEVIMTYCKRKIIFYEE